MVFPKAGMYASEALQPVRASSEILEIRYEYTVAFTGYDMGDYTLSVYQEGDLAGQAAGLL